MDRTNHKERSMRILETVLMMAVIGLVPAHLSAADIDDISNSTWDSTYQDNDGTFVVDAILTLDGDSGTYDTGNGVGTLEGIRYAYITPAPEKKVGVYGTWRLGSATGGFTLRISGDGETFSGTWMGANKKRGTWTSTKRL
jgi:hypothetical protein